MNYQQNIPKLYAIKAIRFFLLLMPIIIPFFRSKGLSMTEIMLLQSVFSFSVVVFEVPSGYFGDIVGRKFSIVTGMALSAVGFFFMYLSDGIYGLIFSEIVLGLAASFISGSDTALLYDSLKADGNEKDYLKTQGRFGSAGNFSEAVAGVIGGALAIYAIDLPILVHCAILFLGVFVALSLKEVPLEKMKLEETGKNFFSIFKLINNIPRLKWWIIFTTCISVSTLTTAWLAQAYFESIEIDLKYYGILWTIINLVVGVGAISSSWIHNNTNLKVVVSIILVVVCVGLPLAGFINSVYGILCIVVINFFRGVKEPIVKERINRFSPSEKRATILSINSFMFRLGFASLAPLAGYLLDIFSFQTAMTFYFIPIFLIGALSIYKIIQYSKN